MFSTSLQDQLYRAPEDSECYKNYLLSKYSNCEKDFILFVYPFKINSEVDNCTLNNHIKDPFLDEVWFSGFSEFSDAFGVALSNATEDQKYNYCDTFNREKTRQFCIRDYPAAPSKDKISFDRCKGYFDRNDLFKNKANAHALKLCYTELVDFDIYYLNYISSFI